MKKEVKEQFAMDLLNAKADKESYLKVIERYVNPIVIDPLTNRKLFKEEFELEIDNKGNLLASYQSGLGGFMYIDIK